MATPLTDRELKRRFKELDERLTRAKNNFHRDHAEHGPTDLAGDMLDTSKDTPSKSQPPTA